MTSQKKKESITSAPIEDNITDISEFSYDLKVPKDRVAVLIGKGGDVKKQIEQETRSKLHIDSKEGDVTISGTDSLGLYSAREVVRAISRGFNPELAKLLLKQDYMMEIVDLRDHGESKNTMLRLKGRVIGSEGKSRRVIEQLTETHISVYGKTIAIIGEIANVGIAKRAIEALLEGAMHAGIFRDLEKRRRDMKLHRIESSFDLSDNP